MIIFIIIGMKITNRKDEINISRLLGASNYYVKRPFLIEGVIYGLIGSLIGSAVSFGTAGYLFKTINGYFNPVIFISSNPSFYLILLSASLVSGCLLGYFASWIGVKRYIRF